MFGSLGCVLLLLCGFVLSVMMRMRQNGYREAYVVPSPLAEAVRQLVGVAGGIYLSLVMLTGFLGMNLPERIMMGHMELDPLALSAMGLACVQPVLLAGWQWLLEGGRR